MSQLNLIINSSMPNNTILGTGSGLGSGSGSGSGSGQSMSTITVFGFTILAIYSITKILNFYGVGVDKYGPYLMFYVFLIICVNIFNKKHSKL